MKENTNLNRLGPVRRVPSHRHSSTAAKQCTSEVLSPQPTPSFTFDLAAFGSALKPSGSTNVSDTHALPPPDAAAVREVTGSAARPSTHVIGKDSSAPTGKMGKGVKTHRFNPLMRPKPHSNHSHLQHEPKTSTGPAPSYLRATTASSNRQDEGIVRKEEALHGRRSKASSDRVLHALSAVRTTRVTRASMSQAPPREATMSTASHARYSAPGQVSGTTRQTRNSTAAMVHTAQNKASVPSHSVAPSMPTKSVSSSEERPSLNASSQPKPSSAAPLLASLEEMLMGGVPAFGASSLIPMTVNQGITPAPEEKAAVPPPPPPPELPPSDVLSMPPPPPRSERGPRISDVPPMLDMSENGFFSVPFTGFLKPMQPDTFLSPRPAPAFSPLRVSADAPHPMSVPLQSVNHSQPGVAPSPLIRFTPIGKSVSSRTDATPVHGTYLPDGYSPSPTIRSSRGKFSCDIEVRGERRASGHSSSKRKRDEPSLPQCVTDVPPPPPCDLSCDESVGQQEPPKSPTPVRSSPRRSARLSLSSQKSAEPGDMLLSVSKMARVASSCNGGEALPEACSLASRVDPTPARSRSRSTRQTPRQTARKTPAHSRAASSLASSGSQISDSPFITLDSAHPANRMLSRTALFQPLAELPEAEGTSHAFQAIAEVPLSVRKPVRRNVSSMFLSEHVPANTSTDKAPRASLRRASVAAKVPAPIAESFPGRGKLSKNSILPAIAKACEPLAPELLRDDDWEKRTAALELLPDLLSQASEAGLLENAIEGLHIPIGAQISDLRSSVVRVACSITEKFLQEFGEALSSLFVGLLPALLKNQYVSKKIIAGTSYETVRSIATMSPTPAVMALLVQWSSDSHHQTRRVCIECISILLQSANAQSIMTAHVAGVLNVVKNRTADADQHVRGAAATAFWQLHDWCPSKADAVLASLDTAQQKLIIRNRP